MGQYHEIWAFGEDGVAETVDHYALGAGAKLREQAYPGSPYLGVIGELVATRWADKRLMVIGDYADSFADAQTLAERGNPWNEPMPLASYYGAVSRPLDRRYRSSVKIVDVTDEAIAILEAKRGMKPRTPEYALSRPELYMDEGGVRPHSPWMELDVIPEATPAFHADDDNDPVFVYCPALGEAIDPHMYDSPRGRHSFAWIGNAWTFAYALLAISDGRGGGDFDMKNPGRWAYQKLSLTAPVPTSTLFLYDTRDDWF